MSSLLRVWALPIALLAIANISATWYSLVSKRVPEPYLDEFFHVPQAQRYCNNDFAWDPKITTPPGLYFISLLLKPVVGCDTSSLRVLNIGAICVICLLSYQILQAIRNSSSKQAGGGSAKAESQPTSRHQISLLDAHSALNISLFPPLFFFSALYYTDVMSTLVVFLSYYAFLQQRNWQIGYLGHVTSVFIGVLALLFRQTNIFWVAVFPAGLAVVDALKGESEPRVHVDMSTKSVFKDAWNHGLVHDPAITDAGFQDYSMFLISIALAAIRKPLLALNAVIPYLVLLALFAGFVAWNGSVVLGDKSAHTATIHLPQMLYFWPYVVFFSIPLTIGSVLQFILPLLSNQLTTLCETFLSGKKRPLYPSLVFAFLFILSGLIAVHYNTIVHPYTLADNRHYVFYAFRILRRHPAIKYLAVPLYYISAWMTFDTLKAKDEEEATVKRSPKANASTSSDQRQPPCPISFVTIWLAATTLSVVTAPLVEPRYFIVPWTIWRLHVPYVQAEASHSNSTKKLPFDIRLVLETIWLLIINAAIGYNFLYRGFAWPSEPGKVQRFLW